VGIAWISAFAQNYPDKPIHVVVPFAVGGGSDTVTRAVMHKVSEAVGQPIVIENKPGAGGMIGLGEVAHAKPDGYTLGMAGAGISLRHQTAEKTSASQVPELDAVAPMASSPMALVASHTAPGKTAVEVFAWARNNPATPLAIGAPGIGTAHHLAGLLLAAYQGITLTHVPYKGTSEVLQDVAGGQIDLGLVGLGGALPLAHAGKIKVLGVVAVKRSSIAPDVPTLAEGGVVGFDATYWFDISGPKGMPKPVIDRLRAEISKAVQDPDVREALKKGGFEPMVMTPAEYDRAVRDYTTTWSAVMHKYNIRASD
jgi:tripartite-type tricarboxylate transporter receptor subunit TctC